MDADDIYEEETECCGSCGLNYVQEEMYDDDICQECHDEKEHIRQESDPWNFL